MKTAALLVPIGMLLVVFPVMQTTPVWAGKAAPAAAAQQLRVIGPSVLPRGTLQLLHVEGLFEGTTWKSLDPDQFLVTVTGAARAVDDPAARPMNPLTIHCEDVSSGKVTISVKAGNQNITRTLTVGVPKPVAPFEAVVNPRVVSHRFAGLGGGVLFYDNQFGITAGDDLYDWCFRDVRTNFLHVLIRPGYEKENDNDDWRSLDLAKFDFSSLERPFRIIKKALERNPDLKIYASLYSPPAWLKTNNSTNGKGSLKSGLRARQELAEYVFAYLKHAHRQGIPVHYLAFFNEPDFPHTQEGNYLPDLGVLAETFHDCAKALDTLIAADAEVNKPPIYVFPDTLGPGAVTRSGPNSLALRARVRLLDRVGVWGVHDYWHQTGTYWNDRFRELRAFPGVGTKPIWMTEWAQRYRHGDLASGVEYGANIVNALRLGAEAWMVFEWCHPSGNQAGLISTDWKARAPRLRYWRSKSYHVFRQIANTTPAGSQVIGMTGRWKGISQARGNGMEYVALRNGTDLIVHLVNTEPLALNYRVTAGPAIDKAEGWLTTPLADMAATGSRDVALSVRGGASTVAGMVPGNSLLSLVLHERPARKKAGQ
jgi:Glycosyl hydrolase family 30 TIM-barrel domain